MSTTNSTRFAAIVRTRVASIVVGNEVLVERLLIALFSGEHLLVRGLPGLGKTLLVRAVAHASGLQFGRVQLTDDLLPAELIGSEILDQARGESRVQAGPIFSHLLLADGIDRAAPKVQGALLEAMRLRRVTMGGNAYLLPSPFLVVATQNPIEQRQPSGFTEAQLDRFLLCHRVELPGVEQEEEVVRRNLALGLRIDENGLEWRTPLDLLEGPPAVTAGELAEAMTAVQAVHVSDVFTRRAVEMVRATRLHRAIAVGAGPRASVALTLAARARASIHGRDHAMPEDLYALAQDVLLHRLRLTSDALAEGRTVEAVLREIIRDLA